ncbi:MAG: pantetheine-phosphate adenylyltransferase [Alphaproteobacteria bacterium]|nr:pantetheine-phosphate adenylyltransferase [Alphaproteobacteria bacterium]
MAKTKRKKKPRSKAPLVGLYPGTFDPITLGHLELVYRAAKVVDRLIIGVAKNAGKGPLFDCKTRVRIVEHEVAPLVKQGAQIDVMPFDNLLVHFAQDLNARVIVRGLRAVSDFEYEIQMAGMNHRLSNDIETVFLMASDRHQFISSRMVKEIARLGGDVHPFVSSYVVKEIKRRFSQESGRRKVVPEVRD